MAGINTGTHIGLKHCQWSTPVRTSMFSGVFYINFHIILGDGAGHPRVAPPAHDLERTFNLLGPLPQQMGTVKQAEGSLFQVSVLQMAVSAYTHTRWGCPVSEPLLSHMCVASEIVVPTVCALCVLTAALLLTLLLRSPCWCPPSPGFISPRQSSGSHSCLKVYGHVCFQALW
jgi:hypothetical protein